MKKFRIEKDTSGKFYIVKADNIAFYLHRSEEVKHGCEELDGRWGSRIAAENFLDVY